MSIWQQKTADIQAKANKIFTELQNKRGNTEFSEIIDIFGKTAIEKIIRSGGLANASSAENEIKAITSYLNILENEVILPLQKRLRDETKTLDITSLLGKSGQLQQEIMNLREQLRLAKEDADNQSVRDSVLRTADSSVSKHQLFLFNRPIRQESIPYIWMSGLLFFFLGIAIILLMVPIPMEIMGAQGNILGIGAAFTRARNSASSLFSQNVYGGPTLTEQFLSIFGNYWVLGSTIFSLVIVVIILILKILGRLG